VLPYVAEPTPGAMSMRRKTGVGVVWAGVYLGTYQKKSYGMCVCGAMHIDGTRCGQRMAIHTPAPGVHCRLSVSSGMPDGLSTTITFRWPTSWPTARATPHHPTRRKTRAVTGCICVFRTGIALLCAVPAFLLWPPGHQQRLLSRPFWPALEV
jgi:hypothetical protein